MNTTVKTLRAGVRLMPPTADHKAHWRAIVFVLSAILLAASCVSHASSDGDSVDWSGLIKQYNGRGDLTIRERFELAIAYANTGDIKGAQRQFEALDREGWHDEAREMLSESEERLKEHPSSLMDLNIVAFVSYVMQDHERSCAAFERILEVDEGNDWPRLYLAWTYGSLGRIDEGIEELEYMVRKHPFNLYIRLLLIYAKTQR